MKAKNVLLAVLVMLFTVTASQLYSQGLIRKNSTSIGGSGYQDCIKCDTIKFIFYTTQELSQAEIDQISVNSETKNGVHVPHLTEPIHQTNENVVHEGCTVYSYEFTLVICFEITSRRRIEEVDITLGHGENPCFGNFLTDNGFLDTDCLAAGTNMSNSELDNAGGCGFEYVALWICSLEDLPPKPPGPGWPIATLSHRESDGAASNIILVYPNPATEKIFITGTQAGDFVEFRNIDGKVIKTITFDEELSQTGIDIQDIQPGIIVVSAFRNDKYLNALKFIKI